MVTSVTCFVLSEIVCHYAEEMFLKHSYVDLPLNYYSCIFFFLDCWSVLAITVIDFDLVINVILLVCEICQAYKNDEINLIFKNTQMPLL